MTTDAAPKQKGGEPVTKVVRVTLTAERWRELRVRAAEQDMSMTRLLGLMLERDAVRQPRHKTIMRPVGETEF